MLLDLTRSPILVLAHECERHVVVRTLQRDGIVANVIRRQISMSERVRPTALSPGASLTRGRQTLMETRLDIPSPLTIRDPRRGGPEIWPDPYEIPTAYSDLLTGRGGLWCIQVQFMRRPNGSWLVMAGPVGEQFRIAVVAPELIMRSGASCEFPLARFTKQVAQEGLEPRESAWDRLAQNDDPD